MRPRAIIYQSGKSKLQGQVLVHLPKGVRIFYHMMRGVGLGFIVASIAGIILSYAPIAKEEVRYAITQPVLTESPVQTSISQVSADDTSQIDKETSELNIDSNFSIVIPKINAKSNVIANVDPLNKKEYLYALGQGVAHAKGTYFPGQGKQIFLFSHSTDSVFNISRYNAVFYLLSKLEKGDQIVLYFAHKKYMYEVTETKITNPDDLQFLKEDGNSEILYLMTCTPPGTSWKRFFVLAKPV